MNQEIINIIAVISSQYIVFSWTHYRFAILSWCSSLIISCSEMGRASKLYIKCPDDTDVKLAEQGNWLVSE